MVFDHGHVIDFRVFIVKGDDFLLLQFRLGHPVSFVLIKDIFLRLRNVDYFLYLKLLLFMLIVFVDFGLEDVLEEIFVFMNLNSHAVPVEHVFGHFLILDSNIIL